MSDLLGLRPVEKGVLDELYAEYDRDDKYERTWGHGNPTAAAYWRLREEMIFETVGRYFDPLTTPLRVLEVGVGHGHELAKLAQLGIPQSQLTGVDLVAQRLVWAKARYPSITFLEQDATRLEFPDNSFDIVTQIGCVVHAPSRELQRRMCQEMVRVLKPSGVIIWWDLAPIRWRVILGRRLSQLFKYKSQIRALQWHVRQYTKQTLSEALVPSRRRHVVEGYVDPIMLKMTRQDVIDLFRGSKVRVTSFGLDWDIWQTLWTRHKYLATYLFRKGWLSTHCFAVVEKLARPKDT